MRRQERVRQPRTSFRDGNVSNSLKQGKYRNTHGVRVKLTIMEDRTMAAQLHPTERRKFWGKARSRMKVRKRVDPERRTTCPACCSIADTASSRLRFETRRSSLKRATMKRV